MSRAAVLIATAIDNATGRARALAEADGDGSTLIERIVDDVGDAGVRDIIVVLGPDADAIIPLVARDNVEPIVDERWRGARESALRVGCSAVPRGTDVALIVWADGEIAGARYGAMLERSEASGARMVFDRARGGVAVVNAELLAELRNIADGGAAEWFRRHAQDGQEI
jgi:CTP:molybdopterin cytidylyltransferase MocA